MSIRPGAPYADQVEDEGRTLIHEGHDCAKTIDVPNPKRIDQPRLNPGGSLTQNGLFAESAQRFKEKQAPPERVCVYEKIGPASGSLTACSI
ncbi:HNH endonuclease domain protein (fragment) [Candidatus Sulfotelmatomonas gaucii]|uniref:HNH endonuclease domain protein n=1 Tax=Candidatus Sulfuritelmatomonas gaucii TaxID=2043161 RepID=A0A2N9LC09_9BACT